MLYQDIRTIYELLRQKRVLLLVKQLNQTALKLYAMLFNYAGTVLDFTTPWQAWERLHIQHTMWWKFGF